MIHAVSAANQHLFARQLDQMFRLREAAAGRGPDSLDDETAIYLIRVDREGDVVESVRLNPVRPGAGPEAEGWEASCWPENPSDELVGSVVKFCEQRGLAPRLSPEPDRAASRS